jgi:pimeloyl-ACP methyl ester carboxylesterase
MTREVHQHHRDAVLLEYHVRQGHADQVPLVYLPGVTATADHLDTVLPAGLERTTYAIGWRGSRYFEAALSYGCADHAEDVQALLEVIAAPQLCLLAWSFGVRQAVWYAAHHPQRVRGLMLLDGRINDMQKGQAWMDSIAQGNPDKRDLIAAIARDSKAIEIEPLLARISCPIVFVAAGLQPGVSSEEVARYATLWQDGHVLRFEDAGHDVWNPDRQRFNRAVRDFLARVDGVA